MARRSLQLNGYADMAERGGYLPQQVAEYTDEDGDVRPELFIHHQLKGNVKVEPVQRLNGVLDYLEAHGKGSDVADIAPTKVGAFNLPIDNPFDAIYLPAEEVPEAAESVPSSSPVSSQLEECAYVLLLTDSQQRP